MPKLDTTQIKISFFQIPRRQTKKLQIGMRNLTNMMAQLKK